MPTPHTTLSWWHLGWTETCLISIRNRKSPWRLIDWLIDWLTLISSLHIKVEMHRSKWRFISSLLKFSQRFIVTHVFLVFSFLWHWELLIDCCFFPPFYFLGLRSHERERERGKYTRCSARLLASCNIVGPSFIKTSRCLSTGTSLSACSFCFASRIVSVGSNSKKYVVFLRFTRMKIVCTRK